MLKRLMPLFALPLLLSTAPAHADEYTDTIAVFKKAGESSRYFNTAHGYAVFPTIGKGGVGIGGAHGKGRVYEKGKYIGDASMTQVTVGFQLGGQAFSEIIFFEDQRALKEFTTGNFEFGAEASAMAITAGASAQAGTEGASAAASATKTTPEQRATTTRAWRSSRWPKAASCSRHPWRTEIQLPETLSVVRRARVKPCAAHGLTRFSPTNSFDRLWRAPASPCRKPEGLEQFGSRCGAVESLLTGRWWLSTSRNSSSSR